MTAALAVLIATGWLVIGTAGVAVAAEEGPPPVVSAVDLLAPAPFPEGLVRTAIGDMIGRPRSRYTIRQSIERAWALGLFDDVWVEEVPEPDGVRLRYHLGLRPLVRRIEWQGETGLDVGQLVANGRGPGRGRPVLDRWAGGHQHDSTEHADGDRHVDRMARAHVSARMAPPQRGIRGRRPMHETSRSYTTHQESQ